MIDFPLPFLNDTSTPPAPPPAKAETPSPWNFLSFVWGVWTFSGITRQNVIWFKLTKQLTSRKLRYMATFKFQDKKLFKLLIL